MINITNSNTLIIIDEGHGRDTPGKRSPLWSDGTQLYEWEFNRFINSNNFGKYVREITEV